jgi:gliding motility-associated-like protein
LLLRSALTLTATFAVLFSGWSQSASLSTSSPFSFECEGGTITVTPTISGFPGPYTFELKFDGLAPDVLGTDAELQPSYTVQASNPGVYEFELIATDGPTEVQALPVSFEVGATVEGSLSLASLGSNFFEDPTGPTTTFLYCGGASNVVMDFDVALNGPADAGTAVTIDWGDGTVDNGVGSAVSHDYAPGSWQIAMTVTQPSANLGFPCQETTIYNVFVGTAPVISLTLASEDVCLNNPIVDIELGNDALTEVTWVVQFDDGSPETTFGPTSAASIPFTHTFTSASCDLGGSGYEVNVEASNACGTTPLGGGSFKVSEPPVLNIASDLGSVVCPNEPVTLMNASTPPALTTPFGCTDNYQFYWELDPGLTLVSGGTGSNNGTPGQPQFWSTGDMDIVVTSGVPGTYQIDLVAYTNVACGGETTTFDLTIAPAGVLSLTDENGVGGFLSQDVCSGVEVEDFTFSVAPADYEITWTVLDADSNAVVPGQIPGIDVVEGMGIGSVSPSNSWTLTNTSSQPFSFLVQATVPCAASEPLIHEIVVLPEPVITASPLMSTICSGAMTNISLGINTGEPIDWNITTGPNVSGPGSTGPGLSITDTWDNTGLTNSTVQYEIFAAPGSQCEGDPVNVEVTVLPAIQLPPLNDELLCPGDNVDAIEFEDIEGATYTWTNSDVEVGLGAGGQGDIPAWTAATNNTSLSFTSTVNVTGQVANCPVLQDSYAIEVQPTPTVVATPAQQTLCSGATTAITLSVNTGEDLGWSSTSSGGILAPGSTTGTGTFISETWTNTGNANGDVVYTIDVVNAGQPGTCPSQPASVAVTVLPGLPALGPLQDQILCPGDIFTGVDFPDVQGAVWSWTNVNPNNGLAANGTGDIDPWVAPENATTDSLGGPVTIVGQVGACPSENAGEFLAIVNQTPTITAIPTDITICSGLSPDVELFLNTDDTLFWTSTWDPEIVGQVEAFGSEVLLDNQFFNTGLNPADVVFTVTVVNALNTNICPFEDEIVTVTVLPGLTPEQFSDVTLCPGEIAAPVALPAIADVTWTWANDNTTTGLGSGGEGDIPAWEALPNTSDTANTGTVTVIGQLPGCEAAEVGSYEIAVLPAPVIVATPENPVVCSGDEVNAALAWNGPGTAEWTADPVAGVQGIVSPNSGNLIDDVLVNTNTSVTTVTYVIAIEVPAGAACPGDPLSLQVDVLPQIPALAFGDQALCPGSDGAGTTLPAIETVEWSWANTNENIGLPNAGLGDVPAWTATNPGIDAIDGTVTIFGEAGGCGPQEAGSFDVSVFPTPQADVTVSPNGNLSCIDSLAIIEWDIVTEFTQVTNFEGGAILTEDIVLLDLDSAVVDEAATYTMTLFSTASGCTATQEIVVNPIDDIVITDVVAMNPLCFEEASGAIEIITDETGPVDYTWTGPSDASDNLATDLLAGDYFVTATNEAGCQDTASVTLNDPEVLDVSIAESVVSECGEDNGYLVADAMGGSGDLSYTWFDADSVALVNESLVLENIDAGEYTFAAEDANGCVTDTTVYLDCVPLPEPLPAQFISPNGDNKNDRWTIDNMYYFPNAKIQVFNRWGIEVFSTEGRYLGDWEGTNEDGKTLPSATYFYVIDTKKKSQRPFNGYLELQTNQP